MCAYLERSEMYDTVDVWMGIEDLIDCSLIPHINIVKYRSFAAYQFNAIECFFRGVLEIVEDNDIVVCLE